MVQLHKRQEVLDQRRIFLLCLNESELGPHQLHVPSFAEGSIAVECGLQVFLWGQREQRLRQTAEIPETDVRLLIEGVAAIVIGVVADESRVVVVDESEWSVVEGDAMDRHIVRIHDSMRPADGLPLRDQPCRAFDDLGEESRVLICAFHKMGKVGRDDIVGQHFELFVLLPIVEDLERAEPHMGRRHPHQHRAGLHLFAIDFVVAAHDAERPRRRNAEAVHRFTAKILPDG